MAEVREAAIAKVEVGEAVRKVCAARLITLLDQSVKAERQAKHLKALTAQKGKKQKGSAAPEGSAEGGPEGSGEGPSEDQFLTGAMEFVARAEAAKGVSLGLVDVDVAALEALRELAVRAEAILSTGRVSILNPFCKVGSPNK